MPRAAKKAQPKPAPPRTPEEEPVEVEPSREPEQTTDYNRRAGGYVLTEHGWVLEKN